MSGRGVFFFFSLLFLAAGIDFGVLLVLILKGGPEWVFVPCGSFRTHSFHVLGLTSWRGFLYFVFALLFFVATGFGDIRN